MELAYTLSKVPHNSNEFQIQMRIDREIKQINKQKSVQVNFANRYGRTDRMTRDIGLP